MRNLAYFCRKDAVNEQLGSGEVGRFCADVEWIIDFVTAGSPAHAPGIFFFRSKSGDNSQIGGFAVVGNVVNADKVYCVDVFDGTMALDPATNFVSVGRLSERAFATLRTQLPIRKRSM